MNAIVRAFARGQAKWYTLKAMRRRGAKPNGSSLKLSCCALNAEGGAAAASALDVGVFELEAGGFEGFDVVNDAVIEVHQAGGVNIDLEAVVGEDLVHHAGLVFEGHRILEAGAAAADDADTEAGGDRVLGGHDLAHLGDCRGGHVQRGCLGGRGLFACERCDYRCHIVCSSPVSIGRRCFGRSCALVCSFYCTVMPGSAQYGDVYWMR